ncbi:DUF805 domain-containing protein [Undibacterium sp. Ji67W]|uniref:DUF805 domain-containing protein n=1 Tax=Undibacterium sp. Ji67W TaxID=3413042 RepID=UPI003BF10CD5
MANEYVEALKNYANFSGCSTRKEYWMFFLYNILISIAIFVVDMTLLNQNGALPIIYKLALFIPSISVGVRRMHDTGRSGWWLIVPIVNLIFLCQGTKDLITNERPKLSGLALVGVVLLGLVPVIGIIAAIALPAYQTYTIKAKVAEVMEVARQAESGVESYIEKNRRLPVDLAQTDFSYSSKLISKVSLNSTTNEIELVLNFSPLINKKILLQPVDDRGTILWSCRGAGINPQYLPANCR